MFYCCNFIVYIYILSIFKKHIYHLLPTTFSGILQHCFWMPIRKQWWTSFGVSGGKESACNTKTQVQFLDWENPLEKGMTTHSIILTWRIKWMEEPDRLQSTELQRVGHDWATNTFINTVCIIFLQYSWWIHYHFSSIMLYLYVFLTSPVKSVSNALKFSKYSLFTILFKVISWHSLLREFLRDSKHNAGLNIKVRWTRCYFTCWFI